MAASNFKSVHEHLKSFQLHDDKAISSRKLEESRTKLTEFELPDQTVPVYTNEFWTAKQRQANALHEISYRACFKAQLPRFFINLLTEIGDRVYDPFSGRGTTALESAIMGRIPFANDINPLSKIITRPRIATIPTLDEIAERLKAIATVKMLKSEIDLSMFYHQQTLDRMLSIRRHISEVRDNGSEDFIDGWINMVATNRLTGHSKGFFSVYTLPPNQATSAKNQIKINQKRDQVPDARDVDQLILKKSKSLLRNITEGQRQELKEISKQAEFYSTDARQTKKIEDESIALTVTSPPFLDIVQYAQDNWLRCWFNDIDVAEVESKITVLRHLSAWIEFMQEVFDELFRITKPGGWVAFEVGEVRGGKIKLDEHIVPIGLAAGFQPAAIIINEQQFTKTANIWGIDNNSKGTNSNRIVLFHKEK